MQPERGGPQSIQYLLSVRADAGKPRLNPWLSTHSRQVEDVDRAGRTPLFWAAACDKYDGLVHSHVSYTMFSPDVVLALLEGGADPGHRDNNGATALDYSEVRRHRFGMFLLTYQALGMYKCAEILKKAS